MIVYSNQELKDGDIVGVLLRFEGTRGPLGRSGFVVLKKASRDDRAGRKRWSATFDMDSVEEKTPGAIQLNEARQMINDGPHVEIFGNEGYTILINPQ